MTIIKLLCSPPLHLSVMTSRFVENQLQSVAILIASDAMSITPRPSFVLCVVTLLLMVTACAPFAPPERAAQSEPMPSAYLHPSSEARYPKSWWQAFDAPELNALVEEALGNNFSLRESWARLRQAEALVIRSRADSYPDLSLDGSSSVGQRQTANGQRTTDSEESYALGLSSGYEIDLWGRINSMRQAELLEAMATREELNAAAITLAANVTTRWIGIIAQRLQRALVEAQLKANQTVLELLELRFRKSLASALDLTPL